MGTQTNICFGCKRACGGCSWSEVDAQTGKIRFEPVPGWTATKLVKHIDYFKGYHRVMETYHITACPLFEEEKR